LAVLRKNLPFLNRSITSTTTVGAVRVILCLGTTAFTRLAAQISKKLFRWGDTYVIDYADPRNEILVLMLAIAIDAANCTQNNN
jgi:hypothetical protein